MGLDLLVRIFPLMFMFIYRAVRGHIIAVSKVYYY